MFLYNSQPIQKLYQGSSIVDRVISNNSTIYEELEFWEITTKPIGESFPGSSTQFFIDLTRGSDSIGEFALDPNFIIDWGDGSPIENVTTSSLFAGGANHSYTGQQVSRTIKLKGSFSANGYIGFRINAFGSSQRLVQSLGPMPYVPGLTSLFQSFSENNSLTTVPPNLFALNPQISNFDRTFFGVTLTTESYSNLLINMASNANQRPNNVLFGGGNSKYNIAGQAARQILEAKGWIFTDGGLV